MRPVSSILSSGDRDDMGVTSRVDPRWILVATVAAVLAFDQLSKEIALHRLLDGPATIGGIDLRLVANRGILFGFPAPVAVVVLATIAVVVVAVRSSRGAGLLPVVAYGLLVGGALGNLVDRFQDRHFFPPGAVVDWIVAGRFTFNLADVFLVAAMVMLLVLPTRRSRAGATVDTSAHLHAQG
ncbi:MAG: signal peptidase II [Actinomycetia bacterium]|nr:signal peptidase II [Actinomycetes bacterium]